MEIKLLSCPLCMKPHFEGVDALRSSLINVATSQISCPVCNEVLLGLDKLTIHLFSHITKDIVQKNMLKLNQLAHDVKDVVTEGPPQLSHAIEEENSRKEAAVVKQIRCDICNFSFSDENILDIHQNLLHQTNVDKKTGVYNYHCHLCSKKFKLKGSLMVHLRVAHFGFGRQPRDEDTFTFARADPHREESGVVQQGATEQLAGGKTRDNKHWECDVCMKLFTTKYFLKKHKRLHTGEMPYYCTQCNKFFTFQQSYHKHMLYHSSEKPHTCNECGRSFKELSTLHNHERIHSGERPFACETCGKCFRQRVSLLVHRRIHTGVMPYKCTACNKSFRYKVSQKSHKCSANPPGLVIRESNLLEKLMQKTASRPPPENGDAEATPQIRIKQERRHKQNETIARGSPQNGFGLLLGGGEENFLHLNNAHVQEYFYAASDQKNNPPSVENSIKMMNERVGSDQQEKSLENTDFFSLVLSPVLPEVELLSLSNPSSNEAVSSNNTLETINEESFKNLLYGRPE